MSDSQTEEAKQKSATTKRPKPLVVSYSRGSSSDRSEYEAGLEKELENGNVPKILLEGARLVGEGE